MASITFDLRCYRSSASKRGFWPSAGLFVGARESPERQESLEDLSGQLAQAQDLARRQLHEEEELRLELQKMKERIRATKEKLVYQELCGCYGAFRA